MKIALVCNHFPPEFFGGTERVVWALAKSLKASGDDVVVVSGSDQPHDGRDVIEAEYDGLTVLRLRRKPDEGYGLVVRNLRLRDLVIDECLRRGVQVVHLHHWSTLSGQLARRARSRGLRVIATLHDLWVTCGRFFRRPPPGIVCPQGSSRDACADCAALSLHVPLPSLRRGLRHRDREMQQELRAVHVITAPSSFCAGAVAELTPWSGRIEVVPHGLLEPVTESERASQRRPGEPLRVGTFGNLVREKGVLELVRSATGIPDLELHLSGPFLGDGFEAEVRTTAARAGVHLICHGPWLPGTPHPASRLHLAVFPSQCQETYGLVVDEAIARGVPVIASALGALGERVGAAGVVCQPSVAELATHLRALAADPARLADLASRCGGQALGIHDAARRYRALYAG